MTVDICRRPIAAAECGPRLDPNCQAVRHGTSSAYVNQGCRCPNAREAWRLYSKRRNAGVHLIRYVNPVGTSRRLQGLGAAGWSTALIAARLGVHPTRVERLRRCTTAYVSPATAAAVRKLTAELCLSLGPSQRSRDEAVRRGWEPLGVWDDIDDPDAMPIHGQRGDDIVDDVAIRRVLTGALPFKALRDAEKFVLFRDHLGDWSFNPIMRLLGMSARTVASWRERVAEHEQVAA